MPAKARRMLIASGVLVALSVALAVLPKDWIEEVAGADPDAGSGLVELLISLVPLVIGLALGVGAIALTRSANRVARNEAADEPPQ